MECVDGDCNCGSACQNQRFQRKAYAHVSVIKTEKKGFGLRADADLNPNDFIFEYIGEVINEPTFRRRMLQYDEEGIKHFYFMSLTKHEFVDATKKGNLGRFCNHSCNPNCYVDKWVVGEKLRMGIFAGRSIKAGEELVFNYNVDRYGADPQPCYCGEPNCTGFIGGKTQTERATKLPLATIEALGIDDGDNWDTAVAKKPRRKRASEDDEDYVNSMQPRALDEDGVTKVMAALLQCKEKWIAVKLLARIQDAGDERVLHRAVRMHGYQILRTTLNSFLDDHNVVLQILDILDKFPRLTKNKISDSKIETTIEELALSEHEDVAGESKRLLQEWSKLETAYRIPRKKFDPAAPAANSFEDRRGILREEEPATKQPQSPFQNIVIPKGPKSNIPQRNASYFNPQRPRRPPQAFGLPAGWFATTDARGNVYYYTKSGATTWSRPTAPADKAATSAVKAPSKAEQEKAAVQEIIDSLTKETPKLSASQTPQGAGTPAHEPKKEKWRSYPREKQMKIYENTVGLR
jgi:[histone H3]-lysine36 N-trimethyltransferase